MEQLIYLTGKIIFGVVLFLIFLKICYPNEKLIHIIDAFFHLGIYHTVFYSYSVFINIIRLFFIGLTFMVYYQFEYSLYMGIIYLVLYLILLFKIVKTQFIGDFSFRKDFDYHKHCAPPHVIRIVWKSKSFRSKAYSLQLAKIGEINHEHFGNINLNTFISNQFSFTTFNSIVETSKSTKSIGQIMFWSFKNSINTFFKELNQEARYSKEKAIFLDVPNIVKFEDNIGLIVNVDKVYREIEAKLHEDKRLKLSNIITDLENEIEEIKFHSDSIETNIEIVKTEIRNEFRQQLDKVKNVLIEDFTQKDLINTITNGMITNKIEIDYKLKVSIRNFVYYNFKNYAGRSGDYKFHNNNMALVNHLPILNKILIANYRKINCDKQKISELLNLYFESVKAVKTIQNF